MPTAASPRGRSASKTKGDAPAAAPATSPARKSTRTSSAKPRASPAATPAEKQQQQPPREASPSPQLYTKTYPAGGAAAYSTGVPGASARASLLSTSTTTVTRRSGAAVAAASAPQLPPQLPTAAHRSSILSAGAKSTLIAPPSSTAPSAAAAAASSRSHVVGPLSGAAKTQPYLVEDDFADSAYYPRTVMLLMMVCGVITYAAHVMTNSNKDWLFNAKVGAGALSFAFLVFCGVYVPDELFVRPHPAVWRVLVGVNILYVSLITFLIFQDVPTIRGYLAALDPRLAHDLPERSYAEDCRLSTPEDPYKWFHTIFDEFLLAHFLGYFSKTLITRDWRVILMISVLFEVVELSFQHILPNFKECWWDHVIIDILICNAGGMIAGHFFLRYFKLDNFQWAKLKDIPSVAGKLKRVVGQIAPRRIDPYQWQMYSSPFRLSVVVFFVAFNLTQEFNCFTIKSILQMPSSHPLTISRLVIWGLIAVPSTRALYVYVVEEGPMRAKRVPMAAWLAFTTLFFECVWINKMRIEGGYFQEPMPGYVGVPLYTSFCLFGLWAVMHFMLPACRKSFAFRVATNVVFYLIPVCLLALFVMTNVDMKWGQASFMSFVEKYRPFGFGPLEPGHLLPKSQRVGL